jgi:hypothetical protein
MLVKTRLLALILILCAYGVLFAQDKKSDEPQDKYTTVNIMLTQITATKLGSIVQYFGKDELKLLYIPDDFYNKNIAVNVWENDTKISPQMNVVYKNLKPFRVKIYIPKNASSLTYRYKELLTDEEKDKFKTSEIIIEN